MADTGQETILIVDDEPSNLFVLNEVLRDHYKVRPAISGKRALLATAVSPRPDLILLDVMMPEMDGYAVLRQLRDNPETADIPVIFVTALENEINEKKGLQLGAVDYIVKPIKPAIVLARIHTHLALKQARDQLQHQNTWLEAEILRRMEEILLIQDVGIHALAQLAETRDPETGNHLRRTQEYVALLAQELRSLPKYRDLLDDHYIQLLTKSAPLHDIGKVGIPDTILLKPGKLTREEMAVMQTHAKLGADAIEQAVRATGKPVKFLTLAIEIAHWHHERWDGSGYPDGLAGEAIPLSARLMALADVFDALLSSRIYKPPYPFGEARDIIIQGRGTHFDPEITDAFLARFGDFVAIVQNYQGGT